jgi:predicted transposase/invertase (TIGR01784 family)
MYVNNKFKNSVFTMLFDDPDLLRELYCALEGVYLPPDIPVSINTLENVLFMDFNNDISFEIAGKLVVLIEHQSTINPNMATRLLIYFTRVIEKIIKGDVLYSKKKISIPYPEFYVLYNGTDPFPDEQVLKLSELFEKPQDIGLPEKAKPLLELEVRVININEGRNMEIVNRCKKLAEYSAFIAKVREFFEETRDLEKAVKTAVKYCQKHDTLKEFLEIHGSEVLSMLTLEWNTEDAIAYAREEGREDGREEGLAEGREEGMITAARNALAKGIPTETVQGITGLNIAVIEQLSMMQ